MKKSRLNIASAGEAPQIDACLGISTNLKGYRLCYFLEKEMQLKFRPLHHQESHKAFSCETEAGDKLTLIQNKGRDGFFIERFKVGDYILCFRAENANELSQNFKEILSNISLIQSTFAIDTKFVSKQKFAQFG